MIFMYMWGTIFAFGLTLFLLGITVWDWAEGRSLYKGEWIDAREVAERAYRVKQAMLYVLLCWTWPLTVPVLVVYGLIRLYRNVDSDSKDPNNNLSKEN